MARSEVLLESFISYYSTLGYDALALWRSTREDIRTEQLDCQRTASRMVSWWSDAYEGWWSALLATGSPPLPILFLGGRADAEPLYGFTRVRVPGAHDPQLTDLARIGAADRLKASVETTHFRDQIKVEVDKDSKQGAVPGTYQAIAHVDGQPLAHVVVDIRPGAGNGPNRAVRAKAAAKAKAGKAAGKAKAGGKAKAPRRKKA
ncbi:MAG TPA: hypothetical protein VL049_14505 [Candidatus Dormibacteraeota bacterium]|nr:hypothetical protein [Candidatus Dormibacteraeota bacterium]